MATNPITLPAGQWVVLNPTDVTGTISLQNIGGAEIELDVTDNDTPLDASHIGWLFSVAAAETNKTIAELFPSETSAVRVQAMSRSGGQVKFSYT